MRHRIRRLLQYIALITWLVMFFRSLSALINQRNSSATSDRFLSSLNVILDDAVSTSLLREQTISSLRDPVLNIAPNSSVILWIRTVQDSLACLIEKGTWDHGTMPRSPKPFKNSKFPIYRPRLSCFPSDTALDKISPASRLCSLLRSKNILLVGPETTFYLHSIWLHALETYENRNFDCLGPEFCTFHHICRPPSNGNETLQGAGERFKKLPRQKDLVASGSAILRYILSTSLHVSSDPQDPAYTLPTVDPLTGVRLRNMYWMNQAKRADVIVLNRGPVPSPAWTYGGHEGNWSFVDAFTPKQSQLCFEFDTLCRTSQSYKIVNAALQVTLTTFLPSIIRTLHALHADTMIRQKVVIWHGNWYIQPHCSHAYPLGQVPSTENLLQLLEYTVADPWSLYYNAQVFMHHRILREILPHYGVIFLPQAIPISPRNVDIGLSPGDESSRTSMAKNQRMRRKDCLRYPFESLGAKAMEAAFLGSLAKALDQRSLK